MIIYLFVISFPLEIFCQLIKKQLLSYSTKFMFILFEN